jgi:hypothetical protein
LAAAVVGSAADGSGGSPDDLGKVTPLLEIGHVGVGLAVLLGEVTDLTVVEHVGDHSGDVLGFDASSNVLTVSTAVNVAVSMCQYRTGGMTRL